MMEHKVQEESSSTAFRCTELCVSYQSVSPVQRFWGVSRAQHDKYVSVQARQGIQRLHDGVSPSLHLLYSTQRSRKHNRSSKARHTPLHTCPHPSILNISVCKRYAHVVALDMYLNTTARHACV